MQSYTPKMAFSRYLYFNLIQQAYQACKPFHGPLNLPSTPSHFLTSLMHPKVQPRSFYPTWTWVLDKSFKVVTRLKKRRFRKAKGIMWAWQNHTRSKSSHTGRPIYCKTSLYNLLYTRQHHHSITTNHCTNSRCKRFATAGRDPCNVTTYHTIAATKHPSRPITTLN